jgi:hypothetical protein
MRKSVSLPPWWSSVLCLRCEIEPAQACALCFAPERLASAPLTLTRAATGTETADRIGSRFASAGRSARLSIPSTTSSAEPASPDGDPPRVHSTASCQNTRSVARVPSGATKSQTGPFRSSLHCAAVRLGYAAVTMYRPPDPFAQAPHEQPGTAEDEG